MTEIASTGIYKATFTPTYERMYFSLCDCAKYPRKEYKEYWIRKQIVKAGAISTKVSGITRKEIETLIEELKNINSSKIQNLSSKIMTLRSTLSSVHDGMTKNFVMLKNISSKEFPLDLVATKAANLMNEEITKTGKREIAALTESANKNHDILSRKQLEFHEMMNKQQKNNQTFFEKTLGENLTNFKAMNGDMSKYILRTISMLDDVNSTMKLASDSVKSFSNQVAMLSNGIDELKIMSKLSD
jgi:hypothetical protein